MIENPFSTQGLAGVAGLGSSGGKTSRGAL